jgi:hypothetical protein
LLRSKSFIAGPHHARLTRDFADAGSNEQKNAARQTL